MNDYNNYKFADILYDDVVNGDGVGAVFFTQGCVHHCEGCQNPQTWDKDGGKNLSNTIIQELFDYFKIPFVSRLTLSGGDPICNYELSLKITKDFKELYPDKSLWLFTGYYLKDIPKEILQYIDVIIDGPFVLSERDITLKFRGSSNQHIYKKVNNEWIEDCD